MELENRLAQATCVRIPPLPTSAELGLTFQLILSRKALHDVIESYRQIVICGGEMLCLKVQK